jgi:hypothetical protein
MRDSGALVVRLLGPIPPPSTTDLPAVRGITTAGSPPPNVRRITTAGSAPPTVRRIACASDINTAGW